MPDLIMTAEGQRDDYNNQILGRFFNTKVRPRIEALDGNISDEIAELIYQLLLQHSNATNGGEAGKNVGTNEFNSVMEEILRKLDNTISQLQNGGIPITGQFKATYYG